MKRRILTTRKLAAELRKGSKLAEDDPRPQSLVRCAGALLHALQEDEKPAQEVADLWTAEQAKWTSQRYWIFGFWVSVPRRRPRPIVVR